MVTFIAVAGGVLILGGGLCAAAAVSFGCLYLINQYL